MSPPKAVYVDSAYSSAETKAKHDAHDSKMVRNSQKTSFEVYMDGTFPIASKK